ncbi:DUF1349 domain-containing protein [Pontiella desulfatans]|nr:DUF1349 domain-containing protein [Pontiella desulfatans]
MSGLDVVLRGRRYGLILSVFMSMILCGPLAAYAEMEVGFTPQAGDGPAWTTNNLAMLLDVEKNWPKSFQHVDSIWLNISILKTNPINTSDAILTELINFIDEHDLKTGFGMSGYSLIRIAPDEFETGAAYQQRVEIPLLQRWVDLGGNVDATQCDGIFGKACKNAVTSRKSSGEFAIDGTYFIPNGDTNSISAGDLNFGIKVDDSTSTSNRNGYIMYSAESIHTRFGTGFPASSPYPDNADHFIGVFYEENQWCWSNHKTGSKWTFTPEATDILVATASFADSASTVSSLAGVDTNEYGINKGYASGDLEFLANCWGPDMRVELDDVTNICAIIADAFKELQTAFPGVEHGINESLMATFAFEYEGYGTNDMNVSEYVPPLFFRDYIDILLEECTNNGVVLSRFCSTPHVVAESNFLLGTKLDTSAMLDPELHCLERMRQAFAYLHDRGVDTGIFLVGKSFGGHSDLYCQLAIRAMFKGFAQANIHPGTDLMFSGWHTYPTYLGPETLQYSQMNTMMKVLESEEFRTMIDGLPSPWWNQDVGAPGAAGGASHTGGTFTVIGAGDDIGGTADNFHYLHQTLSGDGEIQARVVNHDASNAWAEAGVMIRETVAAGSKHACQSITIGNGSSFQYRTATDGSSGNTTPGDGMVVPYWVKVVRSNDTFTGYSSSNGTNWNQIGTQSISMQDDICMGLSVTSHTTGTLCTATFDNVTVVGAPTTPTNTIPITPSPAVGSGKITSSCDNEYEIWVNGEYLGSAGGWKSAESYYPDLDNGDVIAVKAIDSGGGAGCLMAELEVGESVIGTSTDWKVSLSGPTNWQDQTFDDSGWTNATDYGAYGVSPYRYQVVGMPTNTPAHWIWSSDKENDDTVYFRYTVAGATTTIPATSTTTGDSKFILQWNAVTGRVYSVWGTTNLFVPFEPWATNIVHPDAAFTDAVHSLESSAFYKIKVEMQKTQQVNE